MNTEFERIHRVRLPFDLRNDDPRKCYGVHGLDVWFILKGPKGVVQYMVSFGVYLPSCTHIARESSLRDITGFDVGYHSPTPQYDGQKQHDDCEYLDGRPCYYDGSGLLAQEWTQELFATRGEHIDPLVWGKLEAQYAKWFEVPQD